MEHPRFLADGECGDGSVNAVQRIGDTIRRPTGAWTPTVHHLLRHLESQGLSGLPRVRGIDEQGREILDYIEGSVAQRPWPAGLRSEAGLIQLVDWLRSYHQAQTDYTPLADARWRLPGARWQPGMIIRHGDLGPWNTVWRDQRFVGIIDWDFARPGYPIEDLAQLAWECVPLRPDEDCRATGIDPAQRHPRLIACCERYGCEEQELIDAVLALQTCQLEETSELGAAGLQPWRDFLARGDVEAIAAERGWLRGQRRIRASTRR